MSVHFSPRVKFLFSLATTFLFQIAAGAIVVWVEFFGGNVSKYGILPRTGKGSLGILSAPLFHSNFEHYFSNFVPFILFNTAAGYFYPNIMPRLFPLLYFGSGIFVWMFARNAVHLGASGLVYGTAAFLFFSGLFRWERRSITLAIAVVFLYGSMVWGVIPGGDPQISWESHLGGALFGGFAAYYFRKFDVYEPPYEEDDDDDNSYQLHSDEDELPPQYPK